MQAIVIAEDAEEKDNLSYVLRKAGLAAARRDGLWMYYRLQMPADQGAAQVLRSTLEALGSRPSAGSDRRKLSGLVAIPLKVLNAAAAQCCKPSPPRP